MNPRKEGPRRRSSSRLRKACAPLYRAEQRWPQPPQHPFAPVSQGRLPGLTRTKKQNGGNLVIQL